MLAGAGVEAEKKSNALEDSGAYLNGRQKAILDFLKQSSPVKIPTCARFPEVDVNTLKKDLQHLVQRKSAIYSLVG